MAAIFTVTWMQRNNEHLAILAAGVSTQRAIRPVLVSSVLVSTFAIANQELVMPPNAEELAKSHDDDGERTVHVSGRYDSRSVMIDGVDADRGSKTILTMYATIPVRIFGEIKEIKGQQGTYIPPGHPTAPLKGGWLIRNATINPPLDGEALRTSRELITLVDDLTGFPPPYAPPPPRPTGRPLPAKDRPLPPRPRPLDHRKSPSVLTQKSPISLLCRPYLCALIQESSRFTTCLIARST